MNLKQTHEPPGAANSYRWWRAAQRDTIVECPVNSPCPILTGLIRDSAKLNQVYAGGIRFYSAFIYPAAGRG
jgi:hypothetical protein